jgi:hypothetical protein
MGVEGSGFTPLRSAEAKPKSEATKFESSE